MSFHYEDFICILFVTASCLLYSSMYMYDTRVRKFEVYVDVEDCVFFFKPKEYIISGPWYSFQLLLSAYSFLKIFKILKR